MTAKRLGPLTNKAAVVYDHDRWRCQVEGCVAKKYGWIKCEAPAKEAHQHYSLHHAGESRSS